jgi:hypothetical protein
MAPQVKILNIPWLQKEGAQVHMSVWGQSLAFTPEREPRFPLRPHTTYTRGCEMPVITNLCCMKIPIALRREPEVTHIRAFSFYIDYFNPLSFVCPWSVNRWPLTFRTETYWQQEQPYFISSYYEIGTSCWWRSWLSHCATSQKVAGSIPKGVIGIFHWHNPSGHTMA